MEELPVFKREAGSSIRVHILTSFSDAGNLT